MSAPDLGRLLLYAGLGLAVLGGLVLLLGQVVDLGHLPGDITYEGETTRVYIPITTMLLLSLVLTVLVNLVLRWLR